MFFPSPPVDTRSADDVVASTRALVTAYTTDPSQPGSGWSGSGGPDVASALISVFGSMAKQVIDRLNLFPDKAFLAFLDMVGVAPAPPRPALVPLTFSLAPGTAAGVLVPAGTQVSATPVPGDTGEVTFETQEDLVVTPAALVSALSYQPGGDLYADRTAQATGAGAGFYLAFAGEVPVPHALYLAADAILGLPAGTQVTATVALAPGAGAAAWQALSLGWSYWSGGAAAWVPLAPVPGPSALQIGFALPADMAATTVNGQTARWIRVALASWPAPPASIPAVASVTLTSAAVTRSGIAPDAAASSAGPIDASADFFPFGAQPQFNSTFYLASGAALATPGAAVALTVTLSDQRLPLSATDAPSVAWEVWTGSAWVEVGRSTRSKASTGATSYGFQDGTKALSLGFVNASTTTHTDDANPASPFVVAGVVTFTLPANVAPCTVLGAPGSWLRIRLVGGDNYGLGITLVSGPDGTLTAANDGYRPPIVRSLSLGYTVTPSALAAGLAYNDLTFASTSGAGASGFVPFVRRADVEPALYLGFDRPFENRPVLLYLQVAPLSASDLQTLGDASSSPTLEWEYAGPTGWAPLGATDETGALARSGLLRFVGPSDFTSTSVLGRALFWLRVRLHQGAPAAPPRAGRVSASTVWASHTKTIKTEVLGSSGGGPGQTLSLLHTPVLSGQRIVVREPDLPPPAEQAAIEALEGSDAILVIPGAQGRADQTWVRWHEVPDFHGSGPRDRHYRIDHASGAVTFGDGIQGMVPPQGIQNVWSFFYQSGGGAQGNRAAGTVTQLKNAVASIAGVVNYEEASGGADTEPIDRLKQLGPTALRNGGRAIAAQDYEDLALEASADVARARCVQPHFDPVQSAQNPIEIAEAGQVTLLVVPFSNDMPPTPGLGLLRDLSAYLAARIAPAVTLQITGPLWVEVSVAGLTIVPVATEGADALRTQAVAAIAGFLHPLTGGFDGAGWAFGVLPQASDIYRLVMTIPGVAAVRGLTLVTYPAPDLTSAEIADRILIYSGDHTVVITAPDAGG